MTQRDLHVIRVYTADAGDLPVGVVGVSDVDRRSKTATLWAALGSKLRRLHGAGLRQTAHPGVRGAQAPSGEHVDR
jgi:hypothetical protein